ncbi:MAG: hypothetical protein ACRC8K_13570 [Waterburya sp.]
MKMITKLALALTSVMAINSLAVSAAITQKVDRNTLCSKFPLNSHCQDYRATKSESKIYQIDRHTFCNKFPLNSQCQQPALQVIKLNLDRSGEDDEWVRIQKQANKIQLLHTTRVKDGLVSGALNGALGFVPFPLPFVEANKYDWENHQVIEVTFKNDCEASRRHRCQTNNCTVTGTDTLIMPKGTDIYAGLFTIYYQEKDLRRSLSFKIPADLKAETVDTVTIEAHQ